MKENVVPVVFSTDDNYAPYCGVAIHSLIKHASPNREYEIYVLHTGLQNNAARRIEGLSRPNICIECVNISKYIEGVKIYSLNEWSEATFYRIAITDILKHFPRAIYLDCDVICMCDVGELFDIDLGNSLVGAVSDWGCAETNQYVSDVLGINYQNYFNAGVLVISIERFIAEKIKDKAVESINNNGNFKFVDNDVLNILCKDRVKRLNLSWNFTKRGTHDKDWLTDEYLLDYQKAEIDPNIIHYAISEKPWSSPNTPMAEYFWKTARESIFFEEILYRQFRRSYGHDHLMNNYFFPYEKVTEGSNIILYGAGIVGRAFYDKMAVCRYCRVTLWADRQYVKLRDRFPVSPPQEILKTQYDYVVIAVEHDHIADVIKRDLLDIGVSDNKIIWENPRR